MTFVPATNVAEVFVEHTFNGKAGVGWVWHFDLSTPPWTEEKLLDLGGAIKAWWDTDMQPNMTAQVSLTRIRLRDITTANSPIADYSTGLPLVGSLTGQAMPGNVAFSIKKNTGLAGRSYRGRSYIFGFNEADVDQNSLGAGRANAYVAALNNALLLVGSLSDYGMVVVSKYSGNTPRVLGLVTPMTSWSYADLTVDTRRDRL